MKINWNRIGEYVVGEIIGRFAGFVIGMMASKWFTKVVYEKKGINNLYGLLPRKKTVVNQMPEWLQITGSILIGFVVLELVNAFFKYKLYMKLWYLFVPKSAQSGNSANQE